MAKTSIEWTDRTTVRGARPGSDNPNWKGGRTVTEHGYVLLKRPDHPDADVRGYVYEHRLVPRPEALVV